MTHPVPQAIMTASLPPHTAILLPRLLVLQLGEGIRLALQPRRSQAGLQKVVMV